MSYDDLVSNFRELIGNPSPTEMAERQIRLHLIPGFEWLATELKNHDVRDDDTALALVAGQQKYLIPDNVAWILQLAWNSTYLAPESTYKWDHEGTIWRNSPALDVISFWAAEGRQIILQNPPTAAAVLTDPYLHMRYISGVPRLDATGPYNLAEPDQYLAILRAAIRYLRSHPSDANNARLANFAAEMQELLPQAKRRAANMIMDRQPSFLVYSERFGGAR